MALLFNNIKSLRCLFKLLELFQKLYILIAYNYAIKITVLYN